MSNLLGLAGYGSEGDHSDTDDETTQSKANAAPTKTKSLVVDYDDDEDDADYTPPIPKAKREDIEEDGGAKSSASPKSKSKAAGAEGPSPSPKDEKDVGAKAKSGKKRKSTSASESSAKGKRKAKKGAKGVSPQGSTLMHIAGNYRSLDDVYASREYKNRVVQDDRAESRTKHIQSVRVSSQKGQKYNEKVRGVRAYKNPTILQQIVNNYDLDQYGTHYPRDLFDPRIPKEDTVKEIRDQRIKFKAKRKAELQAEEEKKKSLEAASKKRSKWDNPTKSSAAATGGGAAPSAAASATSGTAAASASQPRSRSVGSALPSAAATSVAHPQLRAAQLSAQIQAAQVAQRSLGVGIGVGAAQAAQLSASAAAIARFQMQHLASQSQQIANTIKAHTSKVNSSLPPSSLYNGDVLSADQRKKILQNFSTRR